MKIENLTPDDFEDAKGIANELEEVLEEFSTPVVTGALIAVIGRFYHKNPVCNSRKAFVAMCNFALTQSILDLEKNAKQS